MGEYINVDGVRTYFEDKGEGTPIVLLHGGLGSVESWFAQVPALAARYHVYIPERRGHGRTPDVAGPITFELMAADTAAFIECLGIGPAHIVGWSDGAIVGALVALRRPELVRKLVLIGQNFTPEGEDPHARELLDAWEAAPPPFLHEVYDEVSPDGAAHFPVVLEKLMHAWRTEINFPLSQLADIHAPTLVMQGDHDIVRVEHSAAVMAALPNAQLAVVPDATHGLPLEKPEIVNRLILDFLADEQTGHLRLPL